MVRKTSVPCQTRSYLRVKLYSMPLLSHKRFTTKQDENHVQSRQPNAAVARQESVKAKNAMKRGSGGQHYDSDVDISDIPGFSPKKTKKKAPRSTTSKEKKAASQRKSRAIAKVQKNVQVQHKEIEAMVRKLYTHIRTR